ncbi:hypothetical protein BC941DRAFT_425862 [Chlamydoabsidia padenii]|nr:hypothetical protein BC941DRAFT_425862 [Chlamydoabsidia padenii]
MPMSESNHFPFIGANDNRQISQMAAVRLKANLETAWDPICIAEVLHTLILHDIHLSTVAHYKLGRLVKKIQIKSVKLADQAIVEQSSNLIEKWRHLIPKETKQQCNGPYPTITIKSPSVSPHMGINDKPTIKSSGNAAGGKQRLTYTHASSHKSITTFEVLLDKMKKKQPSINSTSKDIIVSTTCPKASNKRVRFKPDHQLSTIHEYKHETPIRNSDQIMCSFKAMDICKQSPFEEKQNTWYRPRLIQVPDICRRPLVNQPRQQVEFDSQCNTPTTPTSFDDGGSLMVTHTKIIPLYEMDISDEDEPCIEHSTGIDNPVSLLSGSFSSSYHQAGPTTHFIQAHPLTAYP